MKKRILSLICALLVLLPTIVACSETPIDPAGTDDQSKAPEGNSVTTTAPIATEEETTSYPVPEIKDLNGYTYRIFVASNEMWGPVHFAPDGEQNGNLINDALYRREAFIEEKYSCNVEYTIDSNLLQTLGNHVSTGTDLCEAVYMSGTNTFSAATSGYVLDINSLEGLELEQPWWDQRIQKEYLIGDRLFTLEGDMNMLDELRTICVVFNKELYNNFNFNELYGTPYELVENNKWTYDTLLEMIKGVTSEPATEDGMWGMVSEVSAPYYFFLGQGEKTLTNNGGEFTVNIGAESVSNMLQKTIQLTKNPDVMIVNNGVWFGGSDVWNNATKVFKSGNALFRSNALSSVNGLLDMSSDYGILPVPNNGLTPEYYCYVSGGNHHPLSFPSNLANVEDAMLITEAITYYSRFTTSESNASLRDAFYYVLADYRLARSPEDTRMLDIFFDSKTFDVDQAAKITGLESSIWALAKAANVDGVASSITSTSKTAKRSIQNFLNALDKYYD